GINYRWRRLPWLASVRAPARRRRDYCLGRHFFTGARRNIEHLFHKHLELIRNDVSFPLYVEVNEIYNLACPASPIHYQPTPYDKDNRAWRDQQCWVLAKRLRAKKNPAALDLGGLRQPECCNRKTIGSTSTRLARAPL